MTFLLQQVNPYTDQLLHIVGDRAREDPTHLVRSAEGNVTCTFGLETISMDRIEEHYGPSDLYFVASGHVRVTDPDGTIQAEELRVCWKPGGEIASAEQVEFKIGGLRLRAQSADIRPNKWVFHQYFFTNDPSAPPMLSVSGRELMIQPGHQAILNGSQVNGYGNRLFGFARHIFNLDPRGSGLTFPTPEYRGGSGFGYNWAADEIIGKNAAVQYHSDASPGSSPGNGAVVTDSLIPSNRQGLSLTPRSSFSQRFSFGYLENVFVTTPLAEINSLRHNVETVSLESTFNNGVNGRGASGELFSLPANAILEKGGAVGKAGYLADLNIESINAYRQTNYFRAESFGSLEAPPIRISDHFFNLGRVDADLFEGTTHFGWGRINETLIYEPSKLLTLGIGVFGATQFGTPQFDIDPLVYKNGYSARADYKLGPRTASYMVRYDSHLGWFDHEFIFTQVAGSLEAFVVVREYPGDTHYGITLRINQIQDLISRRNWKRSNGVSFDGLR